MNPTLKTLGYGADDRVVIFHADDVGFSQASVAAYADLIDFGLISSAATMVPCGWFPAVAAYCRAHPDVDMGVHATLTSEWDACRWRPTSTADPTSGLIDTEGYFYRSVAEAREHGDPTAAQIELNTQVERALAAGIDLTHIDTHMLTVIHPKYLQIYVQTALTHRLPLMLPQWDRDTLIAHGLGAATADAGITAMKALAAQGVPLFDHIAMAPLQDIPDDRIGHLKEMIRTLPPGLTHFVIHPSKDTPELRAIADDWRARVGDYEAFTSETLRAFVAAEGIHVVGYRALRDVLRGEQL